MNWDSTTTQIIDGHAFEVYSTYLNTPLKIKKSGYKKEPIFFILKTENEKYYVLKALAMEISNNDPFNINFEGLRAVYSLNGNQEFFIHHDKNELVMIPLDDSKFDSKTNRVQPCGGYYGVHVRVEHYVDWYTLSLDGNWSFDYSEYKGSSWEYQYVYMPCDTGGNDDLYEQSIVNQNYPNHYAPSVIDAFADCMYNNISTDICRCINFNLGCEGIENIIIDQELSQHPCTDSIFKRIEDLNEKTFSEIINRFQDTTGYYYNWNISISSELPDTIGGITKYSDSNYNNIDTKLNLNFLERATKLGIARIILHELTHAYLLDYVGENNYDNDAYSNFPLLWQNYLLKRLNEEEYGNLNDIHHEEIATNFIDGISYALFELFGNSQVSHRYCELLAWGSLTQTHAFTLLPPEVKDSINNIIIVEDTNMSYNNINPIGDECD